MEKINYIINKQLKTQKLILIGNRSEPFPDLPSQVVRIPGAVFHYPIVLVRLFRILGVLV